MANERRPAPESSGGTAWFPADVTIEDKHTGETRTYATWECEHGSDGWSDFIWVDGNYACDCNRALFFQYAAGVTPDNVDDSGQCGDGRYRVVSIKDVRDGRELYGEAN